MKVRKAVIPAAGLGTRFMPFTKAVPKEMLPIVDKPTLQYIVEEICDAGIEELLLVVRDEKLPIKQHFTFDEGLDQLLREKKMDDVADALKRVSEGIRLSFVNQPVQRGTGDAILCAEAFVAGEPFAMLFGDDLVYTEGKGATRQLLDCFDKVGKTVLGVQQVALETIERYSSISIAAQEGRTFFIDNVVEKPKREEAPSAFAALGRYVITPDVFDVLRRTPVGFGGELQITDAFGIMAREQGIVAYDFEGTRYDIGSKQGFLRATVDFALRDPALCGEFRAFLKSKI